MPRIPINIKEGQIEDASPKSSPVIIGIDLGTTNSLVAYVKDGKASILTEDNKSGLVPSVIHFDDNGEIVIGSSAQTKLISQPERTIYSAKRLMGKSLDDLKGYLDSVGYKIVGNAADEQKLLQVRIDDRFYNPIQLSAEILKSLKAKAEAILDTDIQQAVITVPAYFNDTQRQATRQAGKLAGLDVLRIINEPTAASLAYGNGIDLDTIENIVVYDLGGGTFDVSVLHIEKGIFEVLSTHGDTFLGGDDIDHAIIKYWMANHEAISIEDKSVLKTTAEEAKKWLTTHKRFSTEFKGSTLNLDIEEFNTLLQPIITQTLTSCQKAITDSKLKLDEIDKVIMVGGSTRTLQIKQAVSDFFKQPIYDGINPDEVVALGAAIQGDILAGNRRDILLLDVTPLSLGIETVGGLMDSIISRNSKVPQGAGRNYTTSVDGQTKLRVTVYQGERDMVEDNRKLGELILSGIPPMPAGIPKIEIKFLLDPDGILTVSAEELRSNTKASIQIQSQYGISEEEMGMMLIESIQNAEADMKLRSLQEAKTEAATIILSTDKFIAQNENWLSEEEVKEIKRLKDELASTLNGTDKDVIHKAMDTMNAYSRPLAEKALDKAVESNLAGKSIIE